MRPLFVFNSPLFRQHDPGPGHPERAERIDAILRGIEGQALTDRLEWVEPRAASPAELRRVHAPGHVERILALRGQTADVDGDTHVCPFSVDAALAASGACLQAVDLVLNNPGASAFSFCRPPGHHAERNRAMGFCLFNHVAVAAAHAISARGLSRVMIIDPDVHHGNGTQDIFYDRGDVCFVSIHQWPLYPGTGAGSERGVGAGAGATVNVPLPPGSGDADYVGVAERVLLPLLDSFRPELVLFSAGFDAHRDDPLGGMTMSGPGFVAFYSVLLRALSKLGVPAVFSLEGGYSLAALEETVPALLTAILGMEVT